MRIGIDVDGTVCNTPEMEYNFIIRYIMEHDIECRISLKRSEGFFNAFKEAYGELAHKIEMDFAMELENRPDVMSPIPYSVEYVNRLKDEGNEIYFITARSTQRMTRPLEATKEFLDKNGFKYDKIITAAEDKGDVCKKNDIDIMIDDNQYNCNDVNSKGVTSILIDTEYNSDYKDFINHRGYGWSHVYHLITQMYS